METVTVRIAKLGDDLDINFDSLPDVSKEYVIRYGLTQSLNDAAASVIRKNFTGDNADDDFLAAVEELVMKRRDQLLTGDVPGSRAPADINKVAIRAAANVNRLDDETFAALKAAIEARANA